MGNLSEAETRQVVRALRRHMHGRYEWNTLRAAEDLGVPQQTIWRLLKDPPRRMRRATFLALARPEAKLGLNDVIWSDDARKALAAWERWVEDSLARTSHARTLLQRLEGQPLVDRGVEAFRMRAQKQGHSQKRVLLSLCRVIARLQQAWFESHGVERHWSDLSSDERARYLKAALAAELVVLGREP